MERVKITECPRDAMQGISEFISTEDKILYINSLLKVGFDVLDFGSFVSPRAIPQLADTASVFEGLDLSETKTKLLAIVASKKGGEIAASYNNITYLGYPFSFSETFLKKNINKTVEQGFDLAKQLVEICNNKNKELLFYLTMAFGNPYGDKWHVEQIYEWVEKAALLGIRNITLSDITGESTPEIIEKVYTEIIYKFPKINFGLHLHTTHASATNKINSALNAGCRNFDAVLNDKGGCPMTGEEPTANLNTYTLINALNKANYSTCIDAENLKISTKIAAKIF